MKKARGYENDTELTAEDLKEISASSSRRRSSEVLGKPFPDDPEEQLWGGIGAVFAVLERQARHRVPPHREDPRRVGHRGQRAGHGLRQHGRRLRHRRGASPATPATGENHFYGEYLVNAQGEDVVAGIRTPAADQRVLQERPEQAPAQPREGRCRSSTRSSTLSSTRSRSTTATCRTSSSPSRDGKLFMLQCRVGKRNGVGRRPHGRRDVQGEADRRGDRHHARRAEPAASSCCSRCSTPRPSAAANAIAKGLPAGPGGATGTRGLHRRRGRRRGKGARRRSSSCARDLARRTSTACTTRRRS